MSDAPPPTATLQLNRPAIGSFAMTVRSMGMYVMFVTTDVRTEEKPRMMNSVARVTMNDGSPVRTTRRPLSTPRNVVAAIAITIDSQTGRPQMVTPMPMTIPAKPTSEPIERSNSPAIMSKATAVPTIPTWAATSR